MGEMAQALHVAAYLSCWHDPCYACASRVCAFVLPARREVDHASVICLPYFRHNRGSWCLCRRREPTHAMGGDCEPATHSGHISCRVRVLLPSSGSTHCALCLGKACQTLGVNRPCYQQGNFGQRRSYARLVATANHSQSRVQRRENYALWVNVSGLAA